MFNNLCVYGSCENVFGMFKCECNDGYRLDSSGGNCTDVDECESPQSCLYGTCINQEGNYKCVCPSDHDLVSEGNACIGEFHWSMSFFNRKLLIIHLWSDRRTSRCFLEIDNQGRCQEPTADYVTKPSCCCSVGKAWGPNCVICPIPGSKDYDDLCPGGLGYKPNEITVRFSVV